MSGIRIPVSGDRLENAKAEASALSDDALIYLLGVALVSLNEHIDGDQVPETSKKLGHISECLQGPLEVIPPGTPSEAVEAALLLVATFTDQVPTRDRPSWTN